jgi:hypothetical protein
MGSWSADADARHWLFWGISASAVVRHGTHSAVTSNNKTGLLSTKLNALETNIKTPAIAHNIEKIDPVYTIAGSVS